MLNALLHPCKVLFADVQRGFARVRHLRAAVVGVGAVAVAVGSAVGSAVGVGGAVVGVGGAVAVAVGSAVDSKGRQASRRSRSRPASTAFLLRLSGLGRGLRLSRV